MHKLGKGAGTDRQDAHATVHEVTKGVGTPVNGQILIGVCMLEMASSTTRSNDDPSHKICLTSISVTFREVKGLRSMWVA